MVVALVVGSASLLLFLTPQEIEDSFSGVTKSALTVSTAFFALGCWLMAERWRACLNFRANRSLSYHSMGVANFANMLIPGRVGEPLRIYLLAKRGVGAEYGTSAMIQERLGDQVLRVMFIAIVVLLLGVTAGEGLGTRMWAVSSATLAIFLGLGFVVKRRRGFSLGMGHWIGKLPRMKSEVITYYIARTLDDLAHSWEHPGSKKAVLWGLLSWLAFSIHTMIILDLFFPDGTLEMSLLVIAVVPTTAPTQPGIFHGLCLAAMSVLGAGRTLSLQAAIVLHIIQMVLFTAWGLVSWLVLQKQQKRLAG